MLSIIIPTCNRKAYLLEMLPVLLSQTKHTNAEVIVVDDFSKEDLSPVFSQGKFRAINYIRLQKRSGPSTARNTGAKAAKGDWLVFLDDDCIPDPNWLSSIVVAVQNSNVDFFIGSIVYRADIGHFPERIVQNPNAYWPMSANLIFNKKAFEQLGGFDPVFDIYHNEDTEIGLRAVSRNMTYSRLVQASVRHRISYFDEATLLRSAKHAGVWPILKKKYPRYFTHFKVSQIAGTLFFPVEYLYIVLYPLIVLPLLFRYLMNNIHNPRGSFPMFFVKWPLFFIVRRFHIWKEAIRHRIFVL